MSNENKVSCILCHLSQETKISGALSTKDEVTAHENCLVFSSGLVCQNSPQFDDLFGFSVEDVLEEVKRGSKLTCNKCKKKGATVGCEVKRCKRSYHYPCALQEQARPVEDADEGKYVLYCFNHDPQRENNNNGINGYPSSSSKPKTSKNPSEAGSSKSYCPCLEKFAWKVCLFALQCYTVKSMFLYHIRGEPVVILRQLDARLPTAVTPTHPAVRGVHFPRNGHVSEMERMGRPQNAKVV